MSSAIPDNLRHVPITLEATARRTDKPKNKRSGRPPNKPTKKILSRICQLIIENTALEDICREEGMPGPLTLVKWLTEYPDFARAYAHAREVQAIVLFDKIQKIVDDASQDWKEYVNHKGQIIRVFNAEHVNRTRLRVESIKWRLSKMFPKKYGALREGVVPTDDDSPTSMAAAALPPQAQQPKIEEAASSLTASAIDDAMAYRSMLPKPEEIV